jgi:hypothetical protein
MMTRTLALIVCIAFIALSTACESGTSSSDYNSDPVRFGSAGLEVSSVEPGDMIAIPVEGSSANLNRGFFVRFSSEDSHSVLVPPFHVDAGKAYVMVPPMPGTLLGGVEIAICDLHGRVLDTCPDVLEVAPYADSLIYTRESFDSAMGQGLARLVSLAVESVNTLEDELMMDAADADVIRNALGQQAEILITIELFNENLDDSALGFLQQLLDNSKLLGFLAAAGGVSLDGTMSINSNLSSWWASMVQSALLKADFASLLIGEVRGALNLLAFVMNQMSGWPFIGNWAQGVAAWATGLSATLQPAQELINTMIPSDLVQITAQSAMFVPVGQSESIIAYGRFETEEPFNQQLFTQTVSQVVNTAATHVITRMNNSPALSPYSGYVQQVANMVPQWVNNWLTQNGFIQQSVVPGNNFTVLVIDNFSLDMSAYRFDVAGIVANLLNLPYSAVNAFFRWIGIGVGQPVGGFDGVQVAGPAEYIPSTDSLEGMSSGFTTAQLTGVVCRPAGGWWAQWGFYKVDTTTRDINVTVN